jgi:hypothetical protein
MAHWLYALPELVLLALIAGLLVAAMTYMPRLVQRVPFLAPTDAALEFVIRMQAPLFTMTALVLTFTLVEAERNFRQIDSNITTEASQINQLDRLLARFDDPAAQAGRPLLRAYVRSIVKDEWPAMLRAGEGSDKTRIAFTAVSRTVLAIDPRPGRQALIYTEMLKTLDALAQTRDARLDSVTVGLPGVYWVVILFSVVVLVGVSSTIPRTPFRSAVLGGQLAVLGAFVGFVFIMDAPYLGETAVTPQAISKALTAMEQRDR